MPVRTARPGDYDAIAAVIDAWWGRPVLPALPRLFLDLFCDTSLVAEDLAGLQAFLIGIFSPSRPGHAYVHFVGVSPQARQRGLARRLYQEFFALARADGREVVTAITVPANRGSVAFHQALGFTVTGPVAGYNGPGRDYLVFERNL